MRTTWPASTPEAAARRARLLALLVAALLAPSSGQASAWIREPGHFFIQLGTSYATLNDPELAAFELQQTVLRLSLFAEVGLPLRMNLAAEVPYLVATNEFALEDRYRNHSLGDARIQLEKGLFNSVLLSLALELKVPMYQTLSEREPTGLVKLDRQHYPIANFPEVGNGVVELSPKLIYGASLWPRPAWFTAELGANFRFAGLAQGFYTTIGAGAWLWPYHLALALHARFHYNFAAPPDPKRPLGQEPEFGLYTAGTLIISTSPWIPWLKLFASIGGVPVASKGRSAFDVTFAVAIER